jgi:replicative DNA helicase
MELRTKARRLQAESGLDLIVVDYLQLMHAEVDNRDANRVQEVSEISRGLKALARELSVPVIALSQLSRQPEMRESKEPRLSDLRECVTGDSLVVLADGRRVPIRNLVGTRPRVLSVDDRRQIVEADADLVWKVGTKPVFEVRLASGRRLRATGRHRLMAGGGWKRVDELGVGDRLAIARQLPEPAEPEVWPDTHVVLLGQLIGDGSFLNNAPLRYTTSSEANSAAVATAAREGFGCEVKRYAGRRSWHQLMIGGNGNRWHPTGVNAWLRELGIHGQRSHEKRIPERVFRLANSQIALLLRHLWATDGTMWLRRAGTKGQAIVSYSTNSPGLAADVAALLMRLGIVSRTVRAGKAGYRPGYMVHVSGATDQQRFLDGVGAFGPRTEPAERLREYLAGVLTNTNVDTVPEQVWGLVKARMREQGLSTRQLAAVRGTAYAGDAHFGFSPSRRVVAEYADILAAPEVMRYATNDLFWDRVISIESAGEEDVYDLTVPGPSSWLLDGVVSHNSGAIEQDSDLVLFLWREKERGSDDQDTEGEVINLKLAKHRNGPTGEIQLWFKKRQTRFVSYAGERYAEAS